MDIKKMGNDFNKLLGNKIRMLRRIQNITQMDLALELGYNSTGTISLIESGKTGMGKKKILKAAEFFGVHPTVLLSEKNWTESELEMLVDLTSAIDRKSRHLETIKQLLKLASKE